jgi:hypothetical protein
MTPAERDTVSRLFAAGRLPRQQPIRVTKWLPAPDAYEIESYNDELCVLRVATRVNPQGVDREPTWIAARLVVAWTGGDWKLRSDRGVHNTEEIASLEGWTPW